MLRNTSGRPSPRRRKYAKYEHLREGMRLRPAPRLYRDDTTEWWSEDVTRRAGKLYDVFVFDAEYGVHICSFDRYYEMYYVGPTWDGSGTVRADDEGGRDALETDVRIANAESDPVRYFTTGQVPLDQCETLMLGRRAWLDALYETGGDVEAARERVLQEAVANLIDEGAAY